MTKEPWREKWERAEGNWWLIHRTAAWLAVILTFLAGMMTGFLLCLVVV
jgi:hypothetical protein